MILLAGFTTSRNVGTECKSETQERIFLISIFMLLFSFLIFFFEVCASANNAFYPNRQPKRVTYAGAECNTTAG